MKILSVVIIDIEFENGIELKYFKKIHEIEICGFTGFIQKGINIINENKPDILFLGIDMIDGSAFDLLNEIDVSKLQIVFLINKNDLLEKSFSYSGIDYLVKPLDPKQLKTTIQRLLLKSSLPQNIRQNSKNDNLNKNIFLNKLVLRDNSGYRIIEIAQIVSCEVNNNYVILYFKDNSHFVITESLRNIEVLLNHSKTVFYRIHHKYLINFQYLSRINTNKGKYVQLTNGKKLSVSVRKIKGLKTLLKSQYTT
jgi:two-component system, LytTR family, response regulator